MIIWFKEYSIFITWCLIVIGWTITVTIYIKQKKNNSLIKEQDIQNEMIKDFRNRLEDLQQHSFNYWCSDSEIDDYYKMQMLTRALKELTSISRDLKAINGPEYPSELFIKLRQSVTSDSYNTVRPIPITSERVAIINDSCEGLRNIYTRKLS